MREKPAPPEPLRLRPERQLDAHRAGRQMSVQDCRFVPVSGSVA
jgi:hypothetical protein